MLQGLVERARRLMLGRKALAAGAIALAALAPTAASAMSTGCALVNAGGMDRPYTQSFQLSNQAVSFAIGEVVSVVYVQKSGPNPLLINVAGNSRQPNNAGGTEVVEITRNETVKPGFSLTSNWPGDYSTSVTCTAPSKPVATDKSVDVTYNVTTRIPLGFTGTPPTSVSIVSAPGRGNVVIDGTDALYTPSNNTFGQDSFQFAGTNVMGLGNTATVTVKVGPDLSATPTGGALPAATIGQPYSTTITGVNCVGACRFSHIGTVTFNPGELTIDASTGVISGTLTSFNKVNGGPTHSMTILISDNFRQVYFTYSIPVVETAEPTAGDSSASIAANTTNNSLPVVIAGDVRTLTITTPAQHGMATVSGHNILYTPAANYIGPDELQFAAVNNVGQSAPGTIAINVDQPRDGEIFPAAGLLTGAVVGTSYQQQIKITDAAGTKTFAYALMSGALPPGLTLDTATGLISGTPTPQAAGVTYTFRIRGFNTPTTINKNATYNLRVAASGVAEQILPAAGALTQGSVGVPYQQQIEIVGKAATFTFTGTLPLGLTLNATTGLISGTPTAQASGQTYSFSITGKGNASSDGSATASYTIKIATVVAAGDIAPASGPLKAATLGEAYEQKIEIVGKTATFALTGPLPPGLTLDPATGIISGTPTPAGLGQTYWFSVTGTGNSPGDVPVTANYALTVVEAAVTATDKAVEVTPGSTPLPVDLTAGATGGPFTDAAILSVEPPEAGTAKLTMGEFAALTPDWEPGKFYLKFIPNPNFKGTAVVRYALRGSAGVSNNALVTFTVPLGVAAIANQVDGLVRGFVTTRQNQLSNMIEHPGLVDRRAMGGGQSPGTIQVTPSESAMTMNFASSLADVRAWNAEGGAGAEPEPFNAWIEGSVALQLRNAEGIEYSGSFGLVSLGADYLVNDRLLAGFALHIDTMDDGVSSANTNTKGRGLLAGPYLSTELGEGVFLDASVLYGHSWNTVSNGFFSGDFETERLLAKAKLNGLWQLSEVLALRPDATLVLNNERVGDYTITNGLGDFITVAGFNSLQLRLSAGGTLEYRMVLENGLTLTPEIGGSLGLSSTSAAMVNTATFGTLGAGFSLTGTGSWTFGGNVDFGLDSTGLKSATARTNLGVRF